MSILATDRIVMITFGICSMNTRKRARPMSTRKRASLHPQPLSHRPSEAVLLAYSTSEKEEEEKSCSAMHVQFSNTASCEGGRAYQ